MKQPDVGAEPCSVLLESLKSIFSLLNWIPQEARPFYFLLSLNLKAFFLVSKRNIYFIENTDFTTPTSIDGLIFSKAFI